MKMFPAGSPVRIAEHRLEQSKQRLRRQLYQARWGLNSKLAKPSNLLIVTGVGALLGIWLARRKAAVAMSDVAGAWSPVWSLVFPLLIRFVMQRITKRARAEEI